MLFTSVGIPDGWDDVIEADKLAEDYADEEKSIKNLGKEAPRIIDQYTEAFPATWGDRLERYMVLPFHISYAEAERDKAWTRLQDVSTAMTSTLYPIGFHDDRDRIRVASRPA